MSIKMFSNDRIGLQIHLSQDCFLKKQSQKKRCVERRADHSHFNNVFKVQLRAFGR